MRWCSQAELDAMNGADELEVLAKLEPEEEEGATMMGRKARELMLSGQGDAALQAFKVRSTRRALHVYVTSRGHFPRIWLLSLADSSKI